MTDSDDTDGIFPVKRRSYLIMQTAALSGAAATGVASADSHGYGAGGYGEGAYGGTQDDDGPRRRTSSTRSSGRNDNAKRRTSSTRSSN